MRVGFILCMAGSRGVAWRDLMALPGGMPADSAVSILFSSYRVSGALRSRAEIT
jgi:hypothetical protein